MKAIAIEEFGGRDKLRLMVLPSPEPEPGEVLIRVKSAGVNPVDYKIREGKLKGRMPHQFPIILGWDAAGIVESVGKGVKGFTRGQAVYAYCRKPVIKDGTYAQYVSVSAESVALKPKTLGFDEAAGVPLAALTAYQSLFDAAKLQKGEIVLVHAAAGGVGGFAVQLARAHGARAIGTASEPNHAYVRSLGATDVVDYRKTDFRTAVRHLRPEGVDVVFDCVGGDITTMSANILRKGGRLVTILAPPDAKDLGRPDIALHYVFVAPNGAQLAQIATMIDTGGVRSTLGEVFPLEQAAVAHERIETGHTRGKIVLSVEKD